MLGQSGRILSKNPWTSGKCTRPVGICLLSMKPYIEGTKYWASGDIHCGGPGVVNNYVGLFTRFCSISVSYQRAAILTMSFL